MKKTILLAMACMAAALSAAYAQDAGSRSALLRAVDERVAFPDTDLSARYTIVKRDPGGATSTTVAAMFRRDATVITSYSIHYTKLYDPESARRTIRLRR